MITEFIDAEGASAHDRFQAWRTKHQDGVFLTLETRTRANLHGARCTHLGSGPPYFSWAYALRKQKSGVGGFGSLTSKRKLSGSESELLAWAAADGVSVTRCRHCERDGFVSAESQHPSVSIDPPDGVDLVTQPALAAYLFLWNPAVDEDSFENYDALSRRTSVRASYDTAWICPSKRPRPGDRAYLKRTGPHHNGLFARGRIASEPYEADDGTRLVDLRVESILPLGKELAKGTLNVPPLSSTYWTPQASGTTIRPDSAAHLEDNWPGETPSSGRVTRPSSVDSAALAGAGFGDAEANRMVENAAVAFVSRHYKRKGYSAESRETDAVGYDLTCFKSTEELHVEVKGISGALEVFLITAKEHAVSLVDPQFVLAVVTHATSSPQLVQYRAGEIHQSFDFNVVQYRGCRKAPTSRVSPNKALHRTAAGAILSGRR